MALTNERQAEIRQAINRAARMRIGTVFAHGYAEEELRFALDHAMMELEYVPSCRPSSRTSTTALFVC